MSCCHVHLHGCRIHGYQRPQKCNCISVFLNTFAFMLGSPTLTYRAVVVEPDHRLTNSSLLLVVLRRSLLVVPNLQISTQQISVNCRWVALRRHFLRRNFRNFCGADNLAAKHVLGANQSGRLPPLGASVGGLGVKPGHRPIPLTSHTLAHHTSYLSILYLSPLIFYHIPLTPCRRWRQ